MAKGKSILQHCAHCERTTKMEVIGPVENQPEKTWYRCTRCRHAALIDMAALRQELETAQRKPERADCLEYKPGNSYQIGEAIFHVEAFEKLGERRLLENVAAEAEP